MTDYRREHGPRVEHSRLIGTFATRQRKYMIVGSYTDWTPVPIGSFATGYERINRGTVPQGKVKL